MGSISPKICLLAAGQGTRNSYCKNIPKGLLPLGNVPAILRLLECCPPDLELVIATGHLGHLYKEFFEIYDVKRKVTFVPVDKWEGPGSGPGYSLSCCRPFLKGPFLLLPSDAFISEPISQLEGNWMGVSAVEDGRSFCLANIEGNKITGFVDKDPHADPQLFKSAFNGIAFISNSDVFFEGLERGRNARGEIQVAPGFQALAERGVRPVVFTSWSDTGTTEGYRETLKKFPKQQLVKTDEITFLLDSKVVKFHKSTDFISKKFGRAKELVGYAPPVLKKTSHFFSYPYVEGHILSTEDVSVFDRFIDVCKNSFFKELEISPEQKNQFYKDCWGFYHDKTKDRVSTLLKNQPDLDSFEWINGEKIPPVAELMERVPWKSICEGKPGLFHGDLQPENIVVTPRGEFVFLDWRHEFVDGRTIGDLYYDFCKMQHALWINGEVIRSRKFNVEEDAEKGRVELTFSRQNNLMAFSQSLRKWLMDTGFDLVKIDIVTALIYLNIAVFYQDNYSRFLFFLGKRALWRTLRSDYHPGVDPTLLD